ncbi:MAG: membrane protein insertase YidC [Hyphomonadaceae bacterium]
MEKDDQRNFLVAIVLTFVLLIGYEQFFAGPQRKAQQEAKARAQTEQQVADASPTAPVVIRSRDEIVADDTAADRRVTIEAPDVDGSISLKGARIDDLSLKNFYQTVEAKQAKDKSAEVQLLSPEATNRAFYAVVNWVGGAGLPDENSLWTRTNTGRLTPDNPLKLNWTSNGVSVDRTISIDDHYMFTVNDTVTNTGSEAISAQPVVVMRQNQQPELLKPLPGAHAGVLGVYNSKTNQTKKFKDLAKSASGSAKNEVNVPVEKGWIALTTKYWMAAAIPEQGAPVTMRASARNLNGRVVFQAGFTDSTYTLAPGQSVEKSFRIFAGAKRVEVLDAYQKAGVPDFTEAVDWGWLFFITKPFFWMLKFFQGWLGSFGLAILATTVVVKAVLFPVNMQSYSAMSRMRKLMPEQKAIQERFAADKARQQQEIMNLYKREKVNPLSGCLPMIPILLVSIALYQTLMGTIEMRHTPFYGWIDDMSAPDPTTIFNLFGLLPFDPSQIPLIGGFLKIGAWPIMYGVTMFALQGMSAPVTDPTQKMIMRFLPLIFLFLFSGVAAGLAIYWTWSNLITIAQQYYIMRKNGVETEFDLFLNKYIFKKKQAPAE